MAIYLVIGAAARDEAFQDRCWGSIISMSADVMNATLNSLTIQDSNGYDMTGEASKNQATAFISLKMKSSKETIANMMLLNSDINNAPMTAADAAFNWQTKEIWKRLVDVGYNV